MNLHKIYTDFIADRLLKQHLVENGMWPLIKRERRECGTVCCIGG